MLCVISTGETFALVSWLDEDDCVSVVSNRSCVSGQMVVVRWLWERCVRWLRGKRSILQEFMPQVSTWLCNVNDLVHVCIHVNVHVHVVCMFSVSFCFLAVCEAHDSTCLHLHVLYRFQR